MNDAAAAYNRVAYPGFPYTDTHPDRLAVMATLHGVSPAPVESCRVLEIGCNQGANLIPMAYTLPGASFVGFDIAQHPVDEAQQRINALGLRNIRIFQADLLHAGEVLGEFDYIIAHGIYSWVPEPVRDALMTLCGEHLAPGGIAYVSYNALPGGHLRNMMREILQNRSEATGDPEKGVSEGLALMKSMMELRASDPLSALLVDEVDRLQKRDLRQIFHDELSGVHHPVLFSTFMAHARSKGLRFLSESTIMPHGDASYQPKAAELAKELGRGDREAEEQVLDFVRMRKYRETLLCHKALVPEPEVCISALKQLKFSSQAESSAGDNAGMRKFNSPNAQLETADKTLIAFLQFLIDSSPLAVSFAELEAFLAAQEIVCDEEFLKLILQCISARMIQLHVWDPPVSRHIADRPRASASGRLESLTQNFVTTLNHLTLGLGDGLVHRFLALLDGSRDRAGLLESLKQEFPDMPEPSITSGIEMSLRMLHRAGMLVAEDFG